MFRKVVKLILTGGKTEKNIDHCRCMGLLCRIWTKSQIHTLSMISALKLFRTVLWIAIKACDYERTMSKVVKPEVGAARNTPAEHCWLHFAYQTHTNS